jgi:hypothetical protein
LADWEVIPISTVEPFPFGLYKAVQHYDLAICGVVGAENTFICGLTFVGFLANLGGFARRFSARWWARVV